nr:unnamed protein product [Haemonchus contortus]
MSDLLRALQGTVTTARGTLLNIERRKMDPRPLRRRDRIRRRRVEREMARLSTVDLPAATDGVVDSDVDFEERRPGWVDGSETSGFSDFAFYAATYRLAPYCTRAKASA